MLLIGLLGVGQGQNVSHSPVLKGDGNQLPPLYPRIPLQGGIIGDGIGLRILTDQVNDVGGRFHIDDPLRRGDGDDVGGGEGVVQGDLVVGKNQVKIRQHLWGHSLQAGQGALGVDQAAVIPLHQLQGRIPLKLGAPVKPFPPIA